MLLGTSTPKRKKQIDGEGLKDKKPAKQGGKPITQSLAPKKRSTHEGRGLN